MNQRIKELLDKSTYDVLGVKQVDQKQFAELIIRECALVVHKTTGPRSALNVLEHFGVEE